MMETDQTVNDSAVSPQHHASNNLIGRIRSLLERAGKNVGQLTFADLEQVDEFHIRGRQATLELAEAVRPRPGDRVLDIGSGLGGASRALAAIYGCHVTGIDLVREYCRTATELARWMGLEGCVTYRHGDALDLPFTDQTFDIAWTQHAGMNIADKARLYQEAYRVLKPGGRLGLYEVLQGEAGPIHFPVPWAREPSSSHLVSPEQWLMQIYDAGFTLTCWRHTTEVARKWCDGMSHQTSKRGPAPINPTLLLGRDFAEMARNQMRNIDEGRIVLVEAVCERA